MGSYYGGSWEPPATPKPTKKPDGSGAPVTPPDVTEAPAAYKALRTDCARLEELLGWVAANSEEAAISERDLKRLDKAVTVMKAGFKIAKMALRKNKRRRVSAAVAARESGAIAVKH